YSCNDDEQPGKRCSQGDHASVDDNFQLGLRRVGRWRNVSGHEIRPPGWGPARTAVRTEAFRRIVNPRRRKKEMNSRPAETSGRQDHLTYQCSCLVQRVFLEKTFGGGGFGELETPADGDVQLAFGQPAIDVLGATALVLRRSIEHGKPVKRQVAGVERA